MGIRAPEVSSEDALKAAPLTEEEAKTLAQDRKLSAEASRWRIATRVREEEIAKLKGELAALKAGGTVRPEANVSEVKTEEGSTAEGKDASAAIEPKTVESPEVLAERLYSERVRSRKLAETIKGLCAGEDAAGAALDLLRARGIAVTFDAEDRPMVKLAADAEPELLETVAHTIIPKGLLKTNASDGSGGGPVVDGVRTRNAPNFADYTSYAANRDKFMANRKGNR